MSSRNRCACCSLYDACMAVHILETYFDIDEGEDQNLAPAVDSQVWMLGVVQGMAAFFEGFVFGSCGVLHVASLVYGVHVTLDPRNERAGFREPSC
eukprot:1146372-Pelagomonas_calceolata.AAC.4